MNTPTSAPGSNSGQRGESQVVTVPFTRASAESREQGNTDKSLLMTASQQALGTFDIPANGYFDGLVIKVTATGSSDTANDAAGTEDAPWNVLQNITVQEPNGSTIPYFNTGYGLMLAAKFGGYWFGNDPRQSPVFTAIDAEGNFQWICRIPIALNRREALGALPNQDSDATFKFKADLAASATVYSNIPDIALPTVRVQTWLEAWEMPAATAGNMRNVTEPPAMNTTQFWTEVPHDVNAGIDKIRLTRMGNYIRNFIFVLRRAGTSRANGQTDWPEQTTLWFDKRPRDIVDKDVWMHTQYERYGYTGTADTAGAPENGVFPYDFCHDFNGRVSWETRDGWLHTISSSRVEVEGNFTTAGVMTVMYNDIAVAGNVFL
jgi:hypothetical protein